MIRMKRNIGCLVHGLERVGNRDASFQFNENRTGSFRIEGGDSGTFDWYFEDERYWTASSGTIILDFGRGDKACITG